MKKTTLTALVAALFAASAAVYAFAQKSTDTRAAAQTTEAKSKEMDAHHTGDGRMNHDDCPMVREGSKTRHDAHGEHDAALDERGARAMGFSQTATVHHFLLKPDGGVIQVEVKDASDASNRELVRQHLSHIARAFAAGDFETPMLVHERVPPGADVMRRLKSEISYTYEETEAGARVRISTKNAEARAAVQDFLRFQIEDHRTGDPMK
ncbi:MAG: hypothetical protein ACJ74Q_08855 [Pyrinomonadaceae bacterium]